MNRTTLNIKILKNKMGNKISKEVESEVALDNKSNTSPPMPKKVKTGTLFEKSKEALIWLQVTFPSTFKKPPALLSPLKVGIHKDLNRYLENNPCPFSGRKINQAVFCYVTRARYLFSLRVGSNRLDLDGSPAGVVTETEAAYAKTKLKEIKRKRLSKIKNWKKPQKLKITTTKGEIEPTQEVTLTEQ